MSRKELEITADTLEKEEMVKRINKFVEQKPAEASQLIKTWIYEEAV
jgi:flagellar biosynthesis/type III secretory pathway M-ring protein FliF/YscJ